MPEGVQTKPDAMLARARKDTRGGSIVVGRV